MTAIRLGLISDTLYPEQSPLLPYSAIEDAFRNVDAILHTGSIVSQDLLETLSSIAPTSTVRTKDTAFALPEKRILTFEGVRIGLIHGNRHPLIENYFKLQHRLGKLYAGGRHLLDSLASRFEDTEVDVIVFGHQYRPMRAERNGVLLINPGAVHAISPDIAQWQLLREYNPQRRAVLEAHIQKRRQRKHSQALHSTVGILEISEDSRVRAKLIPLSAVACY